MNASRRPNSSRQHGTSPSEDEHRQLHVIEAVARWVHTSLEPTTISEGALSAIRASLNHLSIFVHEADPTHRAWLCCKK